MKYNDTFSVLRSVLNAVKDPTIIVNKLNEILEYWYKFSANNTMQNKANINVGKRNECNDNIPLNDNYSNAAYNNDTLDNKQQVTSSNPQGVIDSIAQDLTSARLQQAIILSEIVGKPRSKTRRKRRF